MFWIVQKYICAFITTTFVALCRIYIYIYMVKTNDFTIDYNTGLPNLLIYLYPRYQKARQKMPGASVFAVLKCSIAPEVCIIYCMYFM